MGQSTFPVPSSGSSTSTILPVNASSVILDGSLTSASTYTTTVNGNGGIAYLVASDNTAAFTIGGNTYTVTANSVSATSTAVGSGASVTVAAPVIGTPSAFTAMTMASASAWSSVTSGVIGATTYFVAVANGTTAGMYSTDGINWTASTLPASGYGSVTYGNGYFVAFAFSGSFGAYSTNGSTWTASTLSANLRYASSAYGLIGATNYYVASGNNSGGFSGTTDGTYSTNGTTWSASTMPSTALWSGQTFGNGKFVAVGSAALGTGTFGAYSTNGTTWTASTLPSSSTWTGVAYGLVGATNYYVAVQRDASSTAGAYSTNGTSWTASTMPAHNYNSVAFGNNYFVALGAASPYISYSSNGTTWTAGTMPSAQSWARVGFGSNTFTALNNGSSTTVGAYFKFSQTLPVNFGIYNGPTTIN